MDRVHDVQSAYRKLIEAFSRPGLVSDLSEEARNVTGYGLCLPSSQLLATMLLDGEVAFKVFSAREDEASHEFRQLTYAMEAKTSEADYIFVLRDAEPGELLRAIGEARIGDLQNPHLSATLIVEARSISDDGGLLLKGPGIETYSSATVGTTDDWVGPRAERNAEYPLGIDIVFVDADHRLLALPRTTRATRETREEAGR